MGYWTAETSPEPLLADDAAVTAAVTQNVARTVGRPTVGAPCLFAFRLSVDAFMEEFFPEESFDTGSRSWRGLLGTSSTAHQSLGGAVLGVPEFYTPGAGLGRQRHVRGG